MLVSSKPPASDVVNVLLQVLDDSRLTDGQDRTVDFNLGSGHLAALADGQSAETVREQVMEEVRRAFRPSPRTAWTRSCCSTG